MSILNPGRLVAGRTLLAVESGAHAEDLMGEAELARADDRALAWHIALGVLRRQGSLDHLLRPRLDRPVAELDAPVRVSLRVGLFERLFSRTAEHAAVEQAVELCRRLGAPRATGLVNAVLRRVRVESLPDDPRLDLPEWWARRWAHAPQWLARLQEMAPLCGVWAVPPESRPALNTAPASAGGEGIEDCFTLPGSRGAVDQLPGFADGAYWIMDPAAAKVADLGWEALGRPTEGWTALDACAAPGGKSFRLRRRGATVTGVDLEPRRLERVREGASRLKMTIATQFHDWLRGPLPGGSTYDLVLVDAPCTGLGTLRRHPEIRWRRVPSDPAAMALRQRPILAAASAHVAPGGVLVYAVCSPEPEEGEGVVQGLAGWQVERRWSSAPPAGDEDAFQAFVLRRA